LAIQQSKKKGGEMRFNPIRGPISDYRTMRSLVVKLAMLIMAGCVLSCAPVREDLARGRELMKSQYDPITFINTMRNFALDKLEDLSDHERRILVSQPPEITTNAEETQLAFAWKLPEASYIEVLSTPPPCIPMTVFRTRQVKFR
jgi:hypothetical protein